MSFMMYYFRATFKFETKFSEGIEQQNIIIGLTITFWKNRSLS